jgi:hypothetical protein
MRFPRTTLVAAPLALAFCVGAFLLAPALGAFAQDAVSGDAASQLCANDGALLKWLLRGLATIGGAAIVTNSKTVLGLPVIGPILGFIGANWATWLRVAASEAASGVKKTAPIVFAFVTAALLLSACAELGLTGQPANDLPKIGGDLVAITDGACADYAPIGAAALLAPDPKVQSIAAMVGGMCDIATGKVLPGAAAKIDATSAQWVAFSGGLIQALLSVKPITLPAAPPAPAPTQS